jgi:Rrf2 family protein
MKISSQEEYGLRILLRIARCREDESMSIQVLSVHENISQAYTAKLTRILRQAGYINSTPGNIGGYNLAKPPAEININAVLKSLGGELFNQSFCENYSGISKLCTNSVDCSIRSLWTMIQYTVDGLLNKLSLKDLIGTEEESTQLLEKILSSQE